MDFNELQRKNAERREQYRPKSMKTDSENEFVFGLVLVAGVIMLFAAYSFNRDSINGFFEKSLGLVNKIAGSANYKKQEQIQREKQRYLENKNTRNMDKGNDGYDLINFVNDSNENRNIYWVDRYGNKKLYKTLKPRSSYEQRSRPHHQWLITDPEDNELGTYYTKGAKSYVVMSDNNIEQVPELDKVAQISNPSVEDQVDDDIGVRSVEAKKASTINFINSSNDIRKIYWIDYKGNRVLYRTLKSGESYQQRTFLTHPWLVTDEHEVKLGIYYPADKKKDIVLGSR